MPKNNDTDARRMQKAINDLHRFGKPGNDHKTGRRAGKENRRLGRGHKR